MDYNRNSSPTPPPAAAQAPCPQPAQQAQACPPQPYSQPPKKKGKVGPILGVVGIAVAVAFMATVVVLTVGLFNSCSQILSDAPTHDSAEDKAFIYDTAVTERDLETFDALRGSFESMKYNEGLGTGNEDARHRRLAEAQAIVDDYRAQLEKGSWPTGDGAFSSGDSYTSPQLWVRVAQLAQDRLEQETGESWRVLNVRFPFIDTGPIPKIEHHDENSFFEVSLVCENGADKGLETSVSYYRWADSAYFVSHVDESRAALDEQQRSLEAIEASGLLDGRPCALTDRGGLFVWTRGADDPLRDEGALTQLLYDVADVTGLDFVDISLLEPDAPLVVSETFRSKYGNELDPELLDSTSARERLLVVTRDDVHAAPADMLRSQFLSLNAEGDASKDHLSTPSGTLVPNDTEDGGRWCALDDESAYDEELVAFAAQHLGQAEENIVAFSAYGPTGSSSDARKVYLLLPQGAFPTRFGETQDAVLDLQHALWQHYCKDKTEFDEAILFLDVYVVDEQSIEGAGGPVDFAGLRQAAMEDPQSMNAYKVSLLLHADFSGHGAGTHEDAGSWSTDFDMDLHGTAPNSREWFVDSYGLGGR